MIHRQCLPSPAQQPHTCGGNLAPTHAPSTGGHFLFEQQATKFCAQIGTADRATSSRSRAGAAHKGIVRIAVICAKSLPPVFPKVNHVSHVDGSSSVGRTEDNTGAFA